MGREEDPVGPFEPLFAHDLPDEVAEAYESWWDWWTAFMQEVPDGEDPPLDSADFTEEDMEDAVLEAISTDGVDGATTMLEALNHIYAELGKADGEFEGAVNRVPGDLGAAAKWFDDVAEATMVTTAHIRPNLVEKTAERYAAAWDEWVQYCERHGVCMKAPSAKQWAAFLQGKISRGESVRGMDSALRHCYSFAAEREDFPDPTVVGGPIKSIGDLYGEHLLVRRNVPGHNKPMGRQRAPETTPSPSTTKRIPINQVITAAWIKTKVKDLRSLEPGAVIVDRAGKTWQHTRSCLIQLDELGEPTGRVEVLGYVRALQTYEVQRIGGYASLSKAGQAVVDALIASVNADENAPRELEGSLGVVYALNETRDGLMYDKGKFVAWPGGLALDAMAMLAGYPTFEAMCVDFEGRMDDVYATMADCFLREQGQILKERES